MSRVNLNENIDPSKGPELERKACLKPNDYDDMSSITNSLTLSEISDTDEDEKSDSK